MGAPPEHLDSETKEELPPSSREQGLGRSASDPSSSSREHRLGSSNVLSERLTHPRRKSTHGHHCELMDVAATLSLPGRRHSRHSMSSRKHSSKKLLKTLLSAHSSKKLLKELSAKTSPKVSKDDFDERGAAGYLNYLALHGSTYGLGRLRRVMSLRTRPREDPLVTRCRELIPIMTRKARAEFVKAVAILLSTKEEAKAGDHPMQFNRSLLWHAARWNDIEAVKILINHADLNKRLYKAWMNNLAKLQDSKTHKSPLDLARMQKGAVLYDLLSDIVHDVDHYQYNGHFEKRRPSHQSSRQKKGANNNNQPAKSRGSMTTIFGKCSSKSNHQMEIAN